MMPNEIMPCPVSMTGRGLVGHRDGIGMVSAQIMSPL